LDRNELGAMLVAAGLAGARDHALIALLAMNGLRVSEAIGADIEQLGLERGHRTLTVVRKGGKTVTMPMAPRTARTVDLAIGERLDGPILLGNDGERLDINAFPPMPPNAPFGGVKQSGFGREGGREGLMEFLQIKNVFVGLSG
jgi:integrase